MASSRQTDPNHGEAVSVTHFRAVNDDGGIALSRNSREMHEWDARERVEDFCRRFSQYHLEVWEQTYIVSPSEWRRLEDEE